MMKSNKWLVAQSNQWLVNDSPRATILRDLRRCLRHYSLSWDYIPLTLVNHPTDLVYKSAIASSQSLPRDLLTKIIESLTIHHWFTITLSASGWSYFQVNDQAIAYFLCQIITDHLDLNSPNDQAIAPFWLNYPYARCCTILRLAASQQLIEISERYQMLTPLPRLILETRSDHFLAKQLLKTLDEFHNQNPLILSQELCRVWEKFYGDSRIFGQHSHHNSGLVKTRLGLTSATQKLLYRFSQLIGCHLLDRL